MRRTPLCLAIIVFASAALPAQQVPRRPFLYKDARGELAAARARGDREVLLVIASAVGANARVAAAATQLGGAVHFRDDVVDYLRVRFPVDRVDELLRSPDVFSAEVSIGGKTSGGSTRAYGQVNSRAVAPAGMELRFTGVAGAASAETSKVAWPPKLPAYPLTNPYVPLADMGAADFRRAHPTYDGRGVVVAMVDGNNGNADPLLAELQVATSIDGQPIRKFAVYATAVDPFDEDDGRWVRMNDTVTAANGRLAYQGKTYTAPRTGTYRIGVFDEARFDSLANGAIIKHINRPKPPTDSSRKFALLWDERTNDVWVDVNQDLSFADEKALSDYAIRPEFGVIGVDKPETPIRESVGFGLQIDKERKLIAVIAGIYGHASLVIGAGVANRGPTGRFDGIAPGAQIANIGEGNATYGHTEAVIRAAKDPRVDVIFMEHSSTVSESYMLRDARMVPAVVFARLVEKYQKPIVVPTHNFPVLGGMSEFSMGRGVLAIGAHESSQNFLINHGIRTEHADNLHITGGYGPGGDGSLKPDILSPSHILSTKLGFEDGEMLGGLFHLPPGMAIGGGTSTATPTATAAVALLISAAKQAGVKHDAYRIKHALTMSARYVPHIPMYKQGNGVVNVAAAWEILKALDTARVGTVAIATQAPVRHALSHLLPVPNAGVGLFEREGWAAGDRGERTVTFTRTSGPKEPMTFAMSWTGNDGTFSAPSSIVLPLNTPVAVPITIAAAAAGVHSAYLTLDHPAIVGHAHRMMATIVAAEQFTAANKFTVEKKTEVPRPGMSSFFFRVPEGTSALRMQLDVPKGRVTARLMRPDTRAESETPAAAVKVVHVLADPMPGVWELQLGNVDDVRGVDWELAEKGGPAPATPVTITMSVLAADVATRSGSGNDVVLQSSAGAQTTTDITITNRMAAFTGGVGSIALGSARRERATVRAHELALYEVEVPKGATMLLARAGAPSDPRADLDVYVFDCTSKECKAVRSDADPAGDESVAIANPAAGKWKIVVDAFAVPAGSTTYDYLDVLFNPALGGVTAADVMQERAAGAAWTVRMHAWSAGAIPTGRVPFAAVRLETRELGDGDVFRLWLGEIK
jgi:hypothetical protein